METIVASETSVSDVEHRLKLLKASRFRRENMRYRRRIEHTEAKSAKEKERRETRHID